MKKSDGLSQCQALASRNRLAPHEHEAHKRCWPNSGSSTPALRLSQRRCSSRKAAGGRDETCIYIETLAWSGTRRTIRIWTSRRPQPGSSTGVSTWPVANASLRRARGSRRWSVSLSRPGVVLAVLTGLNGLNYLDRFVAAATLPLILADLALSDTAGGLLQSAFIITYSLACPVAGWLGDRQPRMRLAAAGVFVWSLATVASGLAPTYALLLVARAVIGVGEASYAVVTPSLLSDCYPADRRARVLGIFYAAIPVGTALGYVLGGLVGEAFGWRAAFFVAGAPGALLAFLLLLLPEPPRGALDPVGPDAATPLGLRASLRALAARRSYVVNTAAQVI